jgi:maintenance of mitochondrial morphology protein 1
MSSTLTFTQGFFLGQLTIVVLIGAFIKFFIFAPQTPSPHSSNAPSPSTLHPPRHTSSHHRTPSLHSHSSSKSPHPSLKHKTSSHILRPAAPTATSPHSILRKTYYSPHPSNAHSTHQPESLDWFNVLIAQTIAQYRVTASSLFNPNGIPTVLASLEATLNDPTKRPSYISPIKITEISMGEEYPIFSNVRIISSPPSPSDPQGGRLQALVDVDVSDDNLTLAIETSLLLNYPKALSAMLPVALSVSVVRFSGTLSISFVPATDDAVNEDSQAQPTGKPKTNLAFSFLPDYRLDLSVRSLIGSRSRLQDIPKIAQLVEARAQAWFEERVVEPRVQVVPLPGIWPRMGKTRVREGVEDETASGSGDGRPPSSSGHTVGGRERRRSGLDNFPSQEETETIFEGLRRRGGGQTASERSPYLRPVKERSNSQVIVGDEDGPGPSLRMPGSLPG